MSNEANSILHSSTSPDNQIPKNTPTPPASSANANHNPRSCVTCRRRKVKCDKKHPCSNCLRQNVECLFPAPGRAPRKPRKAQDAELIDRLRRLESVVQSLGATASAEEGTATDAAQDGEPQETQEEKLIRVKKEFKELVKAKREQDAANVDNLTQQFGTLLVKAARSRYINPGFWSALNAEVEDLKGDLEGQVLLMSDTEEDDYPSPATSNTSVAHPGFVFGLSSTAVQMTLLYPRADQIPIYWDTYKENVEPFLRTLHTPTRDRIVAGYPARLDSLGKEAECILLAMCYAAVSSSWPEDCKHKFGESKADLLARYRFGIEQALARADFLQTDSIFVLQAFIIFVTCLRRNSGPRIIWSLASLAVRLAQGLGLHRDGSHYPDLAIYKQEMRRRLWWQAVLLDSRACEDLGGDPGIYDLISDTKLPRNLNETDIYYEMTELPESRSGCTDMTFCLIRFEISNAFRRIVYVPPGKCHRGKFQLSSRGLEKRKHMLEELQQTIEDKYLKDADLSVPINWVTSTVARLVISKMWLMLYQPFTRRDGGKSLPQELKDQLFTRALESVEYSLQFRTQGREPKYRNYSLLLQTCTQWHAIAFLLSELCHRTSGPEVERAWTAIDLTMEKQWEDGTEVEKLDAHLWKPLKLMRAKARLARDKASTKRQANRSYETSVANPPQSDNPNGRRETLAVLTTLPELLSDDTVHARFSLDGSFEGQNTAGANAAGPLANNLWQPVQPTQLPGDQNLIGLMRQDVITNQAPSTASANNVRPNAVSTQDPAIQGMPIPGNATTQQLPLPEFTNSDWLNATYPGLINDVQDTTMMGDDSVDWATWDDMVQKWGIQTENEGGVGPAFFGGGTNWY